MRTSSVGLGWFLLAVGCGGPGGGAAAEGRRDVWARSPAQPTCATAGEMVDARVGLSRTAPVTARGQAATVTVERCTADAWSSDAQACVSSPAHTFGPCVRLKLTPAQRASYTDALAAIGCTVDTGLSCG